MQVLLNRLIKQHDMQTYGWVEVCLHAFSNSTRRRWEGSFTPRPVWPGESVHGTHLIGEWARVGLDKVALVGTRTPVLQLVA
jgi:hypothetical protein